MEVRLHGEAIPVNLSPTELSTTPLDLTMKPRVAREPVKHMGTPGNQWAGAQKKRRKISI